MAKKFSQQLGEQLAHTILELIGEGRSATTCKCGKPKGENKVQCRWCFSKSLKKMSTTK